MDLGDRAPGRERKCASASCVVRIGCSRLMAIAEKPVVSVDGGERGGYQKLENGCCGGKVSLDGVNVPRGVNVCWERMKEAWDISGRGVEGKGGLYGFKDSCAWTDDIRTSKFFAGDVEHALEMLPFGDVRVLEDGFGVRLGAAGMVRNQLFGLGPELQISQNDIAAFTKEGIGEREVDA